MSTKDAPPSDYGVPTNSVVATPVGYEKRMTLDTGETVRMYPDKLSPEEYAKCRAALFCILSPDTLRGKYFLYNCSCPLPHVLYTNAIIYNRKALLVPRDRPLGGRI